MTALQLLGAWFGVSVPVALVLGGALHHGLAVPRSDARPATIAVTRSRRSG